MRNCDVAEAWSVGCMAHSGRMSTDGFNLFSYNLLIGVTRVESNPIVKANIKVALDYTAPQHFVSQTTSCHVGLAKRVADRVEEPARVG